MSAGIGNDSLLSIGFDGVVAARLARRVAVAGRTGVWHAPHDIVPGDGLPSSGDLLFPSEARDAAVIAELERLVPHLLRPLRLVQPLQRRAGVFARLLGRNGDGGEEIRLAEHAAAKPLRQRHGTASLRRALLVDTPRLTVALARDAVARGCPIGRGAGPGDARTVTDEPRVAAGFRRTLAVVIRRPYPEDVAFRLPGSDGEPMMLIPFEHDLLAVECPLGTGNDDRAVTEVLKTLERWLGVSLGREAVVYAGRREDPGKVADAGQLRDDGRFLAGEDDGIPLLDGAIEENLGVFANKLAANYAHLDAAYIRALVRRHGPLAPEVLGETHRDADLGRDFGGGLRAREARWMIDNEFARSAEDIVRRRGHFAVLGADAAALQRWMDQGARVV